MIAITLSIQGRVQGVGYRAWLQRQAGRSGIDGWVRNRPDGSVQALLAGEASALRALVEACRAGPPLARVDRIEEIPAELPVTPGFGRHPED